MILPKNKQQNKKKQGLKNETPHFILHINIILQQGTYP